MKRMGRYTSLRVLIVGCGLLLTTLFMPMTAFAISDMPVVSCKLSSLKGSLTLYVEYGPNAGITNSSAEYVGKSSTSGGRQTITNLRCSNPSVVSVRHINASEYNNRFVMLRALKPGKAKLTFQYCGKPRKVNVTVKKYKNPCKKFVIGSKNYAARFNRNSNNCIASFTYGNKRVNIVPKKGWRVKSIHALCYPNTVRVKNGGRLPTWMKRGGYVRVIMQNRKSKGLIELCA